MNTQIDHLVIVADNLEQGAAWCQATLGVAPGPGGRHALMGTHNRLLALGGAAFDRSYLEIIALDPDAPPPGRPRWFGMDDPALQAAVKQQPRLVQAVLRTTNIEMLRWGLINLGLPPGDLLAAERPTTSGLLRWRILLPAPVPAAVNAGTVAQAAASSPVPTLIEWQGTHPCDAMPPSGVTLKAVAWPGLAPRVATLLRPEGVAVVADNAAAAGLSVTLQTPLGPVQLHTA